MKHFAFVVFNLLLIGAFAQGPGQDVLVTRSGATYRGNIMELYPDSIVKLRMPDNTVYILQVKDIQKIYRDDLSYTKNYTRRPIVNDTAIRQKGYTFIADCATLNLYNLKNESRNN